MTKHQRDEYEIAAAMIDAACGAGEVYRPSEVEALRNLAVVHSGQIFVNKKTGDVMAELLPIDTDFFAQNVGWMIEQLNDDGSYTCLTRNGMRAIDNPIYIWKHVVEFNMYIQPVHVKEAQRRLRGEERSSDNKT